MGKLVFGEALEATLSRREDSQGKLEGGEVSRPGIRTAQALRHHLRTDRTIYRGSAELQKEGAHQIWSQTSGETEASNCPPGIQSPAKGSEPGREAQAAGRESVLIRGVSGQRKGLDSKTTLHDGKRATPD